MVVFRARGAGAPAFFAPEAGGHRWQRVPPTEKRGRVHTSTVTVAVLEEPTEAEVRVSQADVDERFVRGSGAGGQHRNKTSTAVLLLHRPSGLRVRVDGGRSQHLNRQTAMELLRARLLQQRRQQETGDLNEARRDQVGSGMRGDKIRTVQVRNGFVRDHRTGRRTTYRRYSRGFVQDLHQKGGRLEG